MKRHANNFGVSLLARHAECIARMNCQHTFLDVTAVSGLVIIKTLFAAGGCMENAACAASVVLGRNLELKKFSFL